MLLYKYIDQNAIKVLEDLILKVNDPKNFNDPFECEPAITPFETIDEKEEFLNSEKVIEHYYKILKFRPNMPSNKKAFEKKWAQIKVGISKELDDIHKYAREASEGVLMGDYLYLLCLSNEITIPYDEILMWSHYTKGHAGVRLKIDTDLFTPPCYEIKKIDYSKDRPTFHVKDITLNSQKAQLEITRSLFIKSISWSYENEYRLLFDSKKCGERAIPGIGFMNYVWISPEAIREVVIGCNVESSFERRILKLLKEEKFRHVQVKKAFIDDNHFRLKYVDI